MLLVLLNHKIEKKRLKSSLNQLRPSAGHDDAQKIDRQLNRNRSIEADTRQCGSFERGALSDQVGFGQFHTWTENQQKREG